MTEDELKRLKQMIALRIREDRSRLRIRPKPFYSIPTNVDAERFLELGFPSKVCALGISVFVLHFRMRDIISPFARDGDRYIQLGILLVCDEDFTWENGKWYWDKWIILPN